MPATILRGRFAWPRTRRRTVVTIGVFDGVHLAHQQLLQATRRLARRLRAASVAITFDPDPQHVLHPAQAQPMLMPAAARIQALAALGVDGVWVIPFTPSFARLSARAFAERILFRRLHAEAVLLGEGFVFGRNQRGTMETLRALAEPQHVRVITLPRVRRGGMVVSSSRIRRLIAGGRLREARMSLGRWPSLYGAVKPGAGRGRHLGFPTINIRLTSQVLPPEGVYAVVVKDARRRRRWRGVMNLGVRPTFGPGPRVCEVHLLGFHGRFAPRDVVVSLMGRLRGERCFPSIAALQRQIRHDIAKARTLLF